MISAIRGYDQSFLKIPELTWSPFRGRDRPEYLLDGNTQNIAKHWAGISTGKHNQDVSFSLEGSKGTGKSSSALTLSVNTAKWEAEFLGDDWRDHFDIERTAAIVDTEKADDVMLNTQKYDVRLFDDISLAWGNRNWQSDENKDKNDIFIINRIDNTVNILTSPNMKLIDVVPRSNVNFKGEMDTPYFNFGHTSIKIFKPVPLFRATGYKVLDPYMKLGRDKMIIYLIEAPPKRIWEAYDKERERATEAVKKQRKENLAERRGLSPSVNDGHKPHNAIRKMETNIQKYESELLEVVKAGGNLKDIRKLLTGKVGNYEKARRWTNSDYMKNLFPDLF